MQSGKIPAATKHYLDETSINLAESISQITGISKELIISQGIKFTLEHPRAIGASKVQVRKIELLKTCIRQYNEVVFVCEETNLSSSINARNYFRLRLKGLCDKEYFQVAFLNARNYLITTKTVFEGTLTEAPIYPREIVKMALDYDAKNIILAHNHPGSSCVFSEHDIYATQLIKNALLTIGVQVLDHILISGEKAVSAREEGILS